MRSLIIILALVLVSTIPADGQMERGTKSDDLEDIFLVGADDWHSSIAATPLAIWTDEKGTETRPVLILPRVVNAGERIGWVELAELERYGPLSILHTMASANVSALVIHGEGDLVKSLVKSAQDENIKAYVTVTLEAPQTSDSYVTEDDILAASDEVEGLEMAKSIFFREIGLNPPQTDISHLDSDMLQQSSAGPGGAVVSDRLCPVNPEVREELYDRVEELIDVYEVDGVVLYNFGFLDDNYCFCDVCKEEFHNDTGIDLSRVASNSYNFQRWKRWKEEQVQEIVREVGNITADLGPVELGVALGEPFDRGEGYNYAEIIDLADFVIISPVPAADLEVAAEMTETPVYVRLSDDYVEYIISTQNVVGTVDYIEELVLRGAAGLAFEYDVVYTPLWSELEPPSPSARWLLDRLDGETLGIGDVFWQCDSRIEANDSFEMAETIARRWDRSPGVVLVGDDYGSGLVAAPIASYLNWPILFHGNDLSNSTEAALHRLGADTVVVVGSIPERSKSRLQELNLTVVEGNRTFLMEEMRCRGEDVETVVLTNSHDISLLPPKPSSKLERSEIEDDLLLEVEVNPAEIPAERAGEIVRLKITLTNRGEDDLEDVKLTDIFLPARFVLWSNPSVGRVEITDPITGDASSPENAFYNGVALNWSIDQLRSHRYATLNLEVVILHALDAGWTQPLDGGITVVHSDQDEDDEEDEEEEPVIKTADHWPMTNITYPSRASAGPVEISWEAATKTTYATVNYYGPDGWSGYKRVQGCETGNECNVSILLTRAGTWTFNIATGVESGGGEAIYQTDNFTIDVFSSTSPINVTAFGHTKISRLSLTSAQVAAARNGLLVDVAKDPQKVDPAEVEEDLQDLVDELEISPRYLIVVGGPGSLPLPSTGLRMTRSWPFKSDIYREYQIQLDDDDYQDVAAGRIIGLSVYDASQLVARTLAYDEIGGDWRNSALVISAPSDYPAIWPQSPIPLSIETYLKEGGLDVDNLRWGEATYQRVSSKMNNGQNIVFFGYHGSEYAWQLSLWALMDWALDENQVDQLTLAPQTTTTSACLTARLKGVVIEFGDGVEMYFPLRLEDSMALSFLKAGAVNYVGANAPTWIFVSDDHGKNMYQAMVFENDTVGEALVSANNLYIARMKSTGDIDFEKIDEGNLIGWEVSVAEMLNETANMFMLFGDPAFRPTIPVTPELPYKTSVSNDSDKMEVSIEPTSELGTDWIYWIMTDSIDREVMLNAPPALIGEVMLSADAEDVVVKERGQVVWHEEELVGSQKRVIWPVIRPVLEEERTFTVEYRLVPGQVQTIDVTVGWNPFSIHLDPRDPSIISHLKREPYRSVFTLEGDGWDYYMKESGKENVGDLEPGRGYVIDAAENFTVEIPGKPVELPYRVKLLQGWNLVGVPFNETVSLSNVTVNANHKIYKYSEAVDEGIVSAFLWTYDDGEWVYVSRNDSMVPGEAYMVEAMNDCRLEFG